MLVVLSVLLQAIPVLLAVVYRLVIGMYLGVHSFGTAYGRALVEALVTDPVPAVRAEPEREEAEREETGAAEGPVPVAQGRPADDRGVAVPGYFSGPVRADLRRAARLAVRRYRKATLDRFVDLVQRHSGLDALLVWILVGAELVGLTLGGLAGTVIFLVTGLGHAVAVVAVLLVAVPAAWAIRALDTVVRLISGKHRPLCGTCQKAAPLPIYRCPGCGAAHHDTRPGTYGVLRRHCSCGTALPTLVIRSGGLDAYCPSCGQPLPRGAGATPEIVVAFTGSVGTGKTRLMRAITRSLREIAEDADDTVEAIDGTGERLAAIDARLEAAGDTAPTPPAVRPQGYRLRLRLNTGPQRLFYLFDPPGELTYDSVRGRDQKYLADTDVLVLAIDPLAVERFWAGLPPRDRQRLDRQRSDPRAEGLAFETTFTCLRQMGARLKRISLAVVVTKADLLASTGVAGRMPDAEHVRDWLCDPDGLGLGNTARLAEQYFGEVAYFSTAAVDGEAGTDPSVRRLTRWMLERQGILYTQESHA